MQDAVCGLRRITLGAALQVYRRPSRDNMERRLGSSPSAEIAGEPVVDTELCGAPGWQPATESTYYCAAGETITGLGAYAVVGSPLVCPHGPLPEGRWPFRRSWSGWSQLAQWWPRSCLVRR